MAIRTISAVEWQPEGLTLEPAALEAAKSMNNALVVAGPGAGKTELLAQRACFLLQTNTCPDPYRILAISFKREAAENLKKRVVLRCGREATARFDSMTYDAFAKDLLDRFGNALPEYLRPSLDYEPIVGSDSSDNSFRERMLELPHSMCPLDNHSRQSIGAGELVRVGMLGNPLPFDDWPNDHLHQAAQALWRYMLAGRPSRITFPMISRLAECIIRTNSAIRNALHSTYRYVFLDEFQDTTNVQFSLTVSCFDKSNAIFTAVGDSKQRIMGWAGALEGIFQRYTSQFNCSAPFILKQNHRSRQILVGIQSVFARELDPDSIDCIASNGESDQGECRVIEYQDENDEARHLGQLIKVAIDEEGLPAHEICVLCRARPDTFAKSLCEELRRIGVRVFIDVNRRDTVAEPVSALILDLLNLIGDQTAPEAWDNLCALLFELEGDREDHQQIATMIRLQKNIRILVAKQPQVTANKQEILQFFGDCLTLIGKDRFAVMHPQYRRVNYLEAVTDRLADLVIEELTDSSWSGLSDRVRGIGSTSVMTMHKSKGLEFHTVIFLGLEDGSLWNYQENAEEETCGLFVALSRAKERCIFTFCKSRPGRFGRQRQGRVSINRIYELFEEAGVEVETIDT